MYERKLNNIKPHEIIEFFFSNLLASQNQFRFTDTTNILQGFKMIEIKVVLLFIKEFDLMTQ